MKTGRSETSEAYLRELLAGLQRMDDEHTDIDYDKWPTKDKERYERLRKRYGEVMEAMWRDPKPPY